MAVVASNNNALTIDESHTLSLYPEPATNELHLLLVVEKLFLVGLLKLRNF